MELMMFYGLINPLALTSLLLYKKWADVVSSLLVVLSVGTIAERECIALPAAAVHSGGAVCQLTALHNLDHLWLIFLDLLVDDVGGGARQPFS